MRGSLAFWSANRISWWLLVRVRHGTVELSESAESPGLLGLANRQLLINIDIDDVRTLAQGIVDTIRIPFSFSIRICVFELRTALFVRRSGCR